MRAAPRAGPTERGNLSPTARATPAGIVEVQFRRSTAAFSRASGITGAHDGLALDRPPFELIARSEDVEVAVGPRIGITKAVDHPWRYGGSRARVS